jgi:hypothetical protein
VLGGRRDDRPRAVAGHPRHRPTGSPRRRAQRRGRLACRCVAQRGSRSASRRHVEPPSSRRLCDDRSAAAGFSVLVLVSIDDLGDRLCVLTDGASSQRRPGLYAAAGHSLRCRHLRSAHGEHRAEVEGPGTGPGCLPDRLPPDLPHDGCSRRRPRSRAPVLRRIIDLNPTEHVLRPMRHPSTRPPPGSRCGRSGYRNCDQGSAGGVSSW